MLHTGFGITNTYRINRIDKCCVYTGITSSSDALELKYEILITPEFHVRYLR